ncbi:sugar ABC transporter substrate-binding protein [Clostridium sp. AF19-22AC]|jgi:ribose transport system substrate-binding protein|uniref:Monosaccharide ABC transporter substrate-binding protein (CUT2 family) n=1 Tax=Faecalicatena orotica TaxID=1544 RepID=A0A2Y9B938_9FIRM|nr:MULTISPECIES: substrate-binding domain-containing protein [Clostridia]PWJ31184.1 monosaccharide ABC transporter substrate-binding protein (CUT2 family) [Faecalicatena orotica]RHR30835.1 sugar ABC transporter substrate-binding protein [Clostridium sp. AF19-22AC]SSA54389.1 monosaccharide ABC transporter substrate-binding protein, CUT2 family [Faecalicatena orotica]
MKKKWTIIVSAVLCIMLAVCACSKKEETPKFTGDTTEEPPYQDNLNAISPSAYNNVQGLKLEPGAYISIIGKDDSSSYWKALKSGVEQAAEDLNKALGYKGDDKVKVTYNAPGVGEDIDEQVNILDEELARYPDAIGIASIDADACTVQFDLASENGIPIIALDSGNSYQGIQCTIKTNNEEAAGTGAYKLSGEIENKGGVLLVVHDSKSASSKEREDGFKKEIENNHPDVTIEETIYLDKMDDLKKAIAEEKNKNKKAEEKEITPDSLTDEDVIQYYLEKHPDVKGCFGTNVTATKLALSSLKQAEKSDDIILMGFDGGKDQIESLKNGDIRGLVVQNPFGIGYASVIAASRTILQSGNEAVVDTGYIWVTQENLEEESIQNMLYE